VEIKAVFLCTSVPFLFRNKIQSC